MHFQPLVIGSPRSGFALLCSVVARLLPMAAPVRRPDRRVIRLLIDLFGGHIANEIVKVFADAGLEDRLVFNGNFRQMLGGPKWLRASDGSVAGIRKYIGARGMGDFTLITTHPSATLDYDEVVHSHVPDDWLSCGRYQDYTALASVRHPAAIVNSSLFSLNALTSEYLQRFRADAMYDDSLRQKLALYKYTDLAFFEGIVRHYRTYFARFRPQRGKYVVMRWEDLIQRPGETIQTIAEALGLPIDLAHAEEIWRQLDHVNLTGDHLHNYRRGFGKVNDWKRWMTNRHIDILRDHGFDEVCAEYGYPALPSLEENDYTPFQREVDDLVRRGEIYAGFPDSDMFTFAFNKSNIDTSHFDFATYEWRDHTRIERSCFTDEGLMMAVWDAAESACARINRVLGAAVAGDWETATAASHAALVEALDEMAPRMPRAHEAALEGLGWLVGELAADDGEGWNDGLPPRLLRAINEHNVVRYNGVFYGIPQSAGPLDLSRDDLSGLPGIVSGRSFADVVGELSRR